MRVLHIGKYYPPYHGGMENYMGDLLPALQQRGVDVTALVHQYKSKSSESDFVYQAPSYGQLLYAPISPLFPFVLSRLITDLKPDLLHLHLPNTSALWALAISKAKRIPWVIHWHADIEAGSNHFLTCAYRAYKPFERKLLVKSKAVIVTSPPYLESSLSLSPWRERCHVIPLGRNSDTFPDLSHNDIQTAKALWGNRQRKVLAVSRMSFYKGLNDLIQATANIDSIQLIVVGPGTRNKLKHNIRELNVENKVLLADALSDYRLHALMSTCDCICLPSIERAEAFGLVLLEAMHYGKPAIVSDIPGSGVGWVVQDGITGIHVPPKNVDQLTRELHDLGENKRKWLDMGENAKFRFDNSFKIGRSTDQIIGLYNRILSAKN